MLQRASSERPRAFVAANLRYSYVGTYFSRPSAVEL